jgi:DNA-binding transcriptional MerR regulator
MVRKAEFDSMTSDCHNDPVNDAALLDLAELCDRSGVTPRTVRYYVQQGLLPSPGLGVGARYGQEHQDRLQLIRQLQKQHLPLAEIRRRLEPLDAAAVRALLQPEAQPQAHAPSPSPPPTTTIRAPASGPAGPSPSPSPPLDSAADYVRAVLSRSSKTSSSWASLPPASPPSPPPASPASPALPPQRAPSPSRSQWDRITLAPDVELHVRRPLSRDEGRRVDRLIDVARQILNEP